MSRKIAHRVCTFLYVLLARKFRQQLSLVFTLKLSLHPHVMLQGRWSHHHLAEQATKLGFNWSWPSSFTLLGTLRKSRQRRQREHGETKNLMSKTIAQHVRFKKFIHNVLLARKFRQQFNLVFTLKLTPHPYVMLQGRYRTIKNG